MGFPSVGKSTLIATLTGNRSDKISCAEAILMEDVTVDQFIDVVEGSRAYIPMSYLFNKINSFVCVIVIAMLRRGALSNI